MCLRHRCCLQWLFTGASTIQITARRGCHYLNKFLSTVNIAMATAFKLFILEKSVFSKCFLELNFQAKKVISRVPCTAVFLRSRTSGFQWNLNIHIFWTLKWAFLLSLLLIYWLGSIGGPFWIIIWINLEKIVSFCKWIKFRKLNVLWLFKNGPYGFDGFSSGG